MIPANPPPYRPWLPLVRFVRTQAFSGALLLAVALLALAWANSPWAGWYQAIGHLPIRVGVGGSLLDQSLAHWINDGLMAVFFFLVGLEIKREVMTGELASLRRAALPIAGAVGGMILPAGIYAVVNAGGPGAAGWGIPMATDIAFSLGILALLGERIPAGLKVFLAALAIVDDLGAVLVIAVFYTESISWWSLAIGAVLLAVSSLINRLGVRRPLAYALLGVGLWLTFLASGVHATIAGVLLAFTIPAQRRIDTVQFIRDGRAIIDEFERVDDPLPLTNDPQRALVRDLETRCEQVEPPLQRIEHHLHPWVAYAIMPLFAFANAGVLFAGDGLAFASDRVGLGIVLGLLVGKPLGVSGAAWLAVRGGLAALPEGVRFAHLFGASCLAGIGFTMALFIANLAFAEGPAQDIAKIAILVASAIAGLVGLSVLWWIGRGPGSADPAAT
jgi:NhaA family Na+:H+ antiporter